MRKRFKVPIKRNQSFTLNITSMTDMFTLLLVFLLQTYSTAEVRVEPDQNIRLPSSIIDNNLINGVKINLSDKYLKVEEKEVAQLSNYDFAPGTLDQNDPQMIRPLFKELDAIFKEKSTEKHIKDGVILLQAEKSIPYSTLKKVMYTASMVGFTQVKLITILGN